MERRSFGKTVRSLVTSRKWLTALGAFAVSTGIIVAGWDHDAALEITERIINVVLVLSGLFMGATAIEDAAGKIAGR